MEVSREQNILTEAELNEIIGKALGPDRTWKLVHVEVRRAAEELAGYVGEHRRMTIALDVEGVSTNIYLFLKLVPAAGSRGALVREFQFFNREALMFSLFDKIAKPDPYPWCPSSYLKNENIIVMPDLAVQGYIKKIGDNPDDLPHALLTAVALARFHAAFANYETKIIISEGQPDTFIEEYGQKFKERLFLAGPWLDAGILLSRNFLKTFSNKYANIDVDFHPLFLKAFKSVKNYDNELNTLIHRDLWSNNIMFKYENGVPINALLVDFQIGRYAPPAFDPMIWLYMSTTKLFREQYGEMFMKKYFSTFMEEVDNDSKKRLEQLNYDWSSFREWCEKARMFGIVCAIMICPFAFLDPKFGETLTEDEEDFTQLIIGDRSKVVIEFAQQNAVYKNRMLELFEEFVERYVPS